MSKKKNKKEKVFTKPEGHHYIAIDTNIIVYLANLFMVDSHPELNLTYGVTTKQYLNEFKKIFDAVKNDELRLYIPFTAYLEACSLEESSEYYLTHDFGLKENYIVSFLENFCYFDKNANNSEKMTEDQNLALAYIERGAVSRYSCFDALIMAESSRAGLNLLTKNEQDLIWVRKEGERPNNTKRQQKIKSVNFEKLWLQQKSTMSRNIPSALRIEEFIEKGEIDYTKTTLFDDDHFIKYDKHAQSFIKE